MVFRARIEISEIRILFREYIDVCLIHNICAPIHFFLPFFSFQFAAGCLRSLGVVLLLQPLWRRHPSVVPWCAIAYCHFVTHLKLHGCTLSRYAPFAFCLPSADETLTTQGIYYFLSHPFLYPLFQARLLPGALLSLFVLSNLFIWYNPPWGL